MRCASRAWSRGFCILVLMLGGCWTTEPSLKPPPRPEELTLPPPDDSRFNAPVEYPKGTLNQDLLTKPKSAGPNGPGGPGGPGHFGGPMGGGPGS